MVTLQALTVLELRAKLAAAEALAAAAAPAASRNGNSAQPAGTVPDLLTAFVEAHNTGLLSLGNCIQAQLDSTAAAWGYPPSSYSSSSSSTGSTVWQAAEQVLQGVTALQLPPPPPLHEYLGQQQQEEGVTAGAAALTQLNSYLDALGSRSGTSRGPVSDAVRSVTVGLKAVLTAKLLQQKQLLLPSPGNSITSGKTAQRQLQLVRSHCELLLERLQQQPLLQAVLAVDRGDLGLIVAADEEQQQPGWVQQQQQQLLLPDADTVLQQQEYGGFEAGFGQEGDQPWDSPTEQVPLGWTGAGSFRVVQGQGGPAQQQQDHEQEDEGGDAGQSPEVVHTVAKQQAAVAAELLAKCRLKPWLS